jgi:hypothetical protein
LFQRPLGQAGHPVPAGIEHEVACGAGTCRQVADALEVGHGRHRVVRDRVADVQGDLGERVELLVGDLVEDRAVALVADARETGQGSVARVWAISRSLSHDRSTAAPPPAPPLK